MEGVIMGGGVSLVDGHVDIVKSCANCVYYNTERNDMPCCSCNGHSNFQLEAYRLKR